MNAAKLGEWGIPAALLAEIGQELTIKRVADGTVCATFTPPITLITGRVPKTLQSAPDILSPLELAEGIQPVHPREELHESRLAQETQLDQETQPNKRERHRLRG